MGVNSVSFNLSGRLAADYAALQNDLQQARCLAGDYQKQLSDKSNDLAALKLSLEKASHDLQNLQANIVALREERHRLANEAMRAVALEHKLAAMTDERKRLTDEAMRAVALERQVAAMTDELKRLRERPREFIDLPLDSKSFVITPAITEPRPIKHGRRRP